MHFETTAVFSSKSFVSRPNMNIRTFLKIGSASLALIGSVVMARAADLAVAPVEPAAPIPYAFSWTGFYVGANIGYGFGGEDEVGAHAPSVGVSVNNIAKFDDSGVFGGVQAGYNYQIGSFVVGLEADIQGSGISDKFSKTITAAGIPFATSGKSDITWFGTLRPRVGYAWDRILVYGTGGLAFGGVDYRVSGDAGALGRVDMKSDDTRVGWTAGAGIEYAFLDNWSTKLEYKYVNFGKDKVSGVVVGGPGDGTVVTTNETAQFHAVSLGINYKF